MALTQKQITLFQKEILEWYKKNKRDLPWRSTRDPYKILISEVMSQQTQIRRVIPKYEAWVKALPTIQDLAKAKTTEVLRLWSGLGYNRRALYLQRVAQILVSRHSGKRSASRIRSKRDSGVAYAPQNDVKLWPQTEKELMEFPGIGKYTARAILCFAFNKQVAVVDTNVRKIILVMLNSFQHLEKIPKHSKGTSYEVAAQVRDDKMMKEKEIEDIAEQLLSKVKAYEWNQALMDYAGAMLKNEKIPIPKQSPFKNSDRYYRGQIIKLLLTEKKVSLGKLYSIFSQAEKTRLTGIIQDLRKDQLLIVHANKTVSLP